MPPAYSSDDPWSAAQRPPQQPAQPTTSNGPAANPIIGPAASTIEGTGLPPEWWKRQERVTVTTLGQQGFIFNRYMVFQVQSEVRDFDFAKLYFLSRYCDRGEDQLLDVTPNLLSSGTFSYADTHFV